MLRYGSAPRQVLPWAIPAVLLPVAVIALGQSVTGTGALLAVTAIVVAVIVVSGVNRRRSSL
jgi:hypothetical protein